MNDSFEPIEPCEPIFPEPTPIEISPGRDPELPPLEPGSEALSPSAPPPEPIMDLEVEVEPEAAGGGVRKPPPVIKFAGSPEFNKPEWKNTKGFPSVDTISQYNSFRGGVTHPDRKRPFGVVVSRVGYSLYVAALRKLHRGHSEVDYRQAAWNFIVSYQIHHFLVDRAVSSLEMAFQVANKPLSHNVWQRFHQQLSGRSQHFSTLEESCGCAYSLRNAQPQHKDMALTLARLQPSGYQQQSDDGKQILMKPKDLSHQQAVSQLLGTYLNQSTSRRALGLHGLMLYANHLRGTNGDLFISDQHSTRKYELQVFMAK